MIAAADMGGRTGKMLDRFPSFMLAPTPDKVLAALAVALGSDLDECERLGARIQRAHRLSVADERSDVLALAALAALQPADFFVVDGLYREGMFARIAEEANEAAWERELADPPAVPRAIAPPLPGSEREQRGYDAYVDALREGAMRMIAVLMDGCGTIRALLEGAAALLDADPVAGGVPEVLDHDSVRGGFIHRLRVRHHVMEEGEPRARDGAIVLVENPVVDRVSDDAALRQRESFRVVRGGFFAGPPAIRITGVGDRTVGPMIINRSKHEGLGFAGALEDGQTLTFTSDGRALLDGIDATAHAYHFRGALADDPVPAGGGLAPPRVPWWHRRTATVTPLRAMDTGVPRPAIVPATKLPALDLELGESEWRFSVQDAAFDAARFEEAVFPVPATDSKPFEDLPPSGRVQLAWPEHDPFAVSVQIPWTLSSLQEAQIVDDDLPTLVRAGLERFRAAGIRLDVSYLEDEWVLGAGVLEGLDTTSGPGLDFDVTRIPVPALTT